MAVVFQTNRILLLGMGNATAPQTALTRNWRHVSPSLIRNETTNQLIQEDTVSFANPDTQNFYSQLLTRRIRLQHPNIVKLIYFAPSNTFCSCSIEQKPYRTMVYTEYSGESLADYINVHPTPFQGICPCVGIIEGITYLENYYGFFEVNQYKVFLGLQTPGSDSTVKLWVNSSKAQCESQRTCTEREMTSSLAKLYCFLTNNGFCHSLRNDEHRILKSIKTIGNFKAEIMRLHGKQSSSQRERKKCNSLYDFKLSDRKDSLVEEIDEQQSISMPLKQYKEAYRYQSTPHTTHQNQQRPISVHFIHPQQLAKERLPIRQPKQLTTKPAESLTLQTQNTFNFIGNPSIQTAYSQENETFRNPAHLSQKVYFNYAPPSSNLAKVVQKKLQENIHEEKVSVEEQKNDNIGVTDKYVGKKVNRPFVSKASYHPTILFDPGYGTYAVSHNVTNQNSLSNSPFHPVNPPISGKKQIEARIKKKLNINGQDKTVTQLHSQNSIDFTGRQMELPLRQQQNKEETSAHLPTTSRSPKRIKQQIALPPQPIHEINQIVESFPQNGIRRNHRFNSNKSARGINTRLNKQSLGSKNEKLQQYTKEIRQTEANIRQWISQSTGEKTSKKLQLHQVSTAPLKTGLRVEVPGYKDAKSVYNDSEYRMNEGSGEQYTIRGDNFEQTYKVEHEVSREQSYLSEQLRKAKQIEAYQAEIKAEYLRQKEIQRERLLKRQSDLQQEKEFQFEQRRIIAEREQQKRRLKVQKQKEKKEHQEDEKKQIEKDLEHERKMIQNQMEDLLRNSAMKEEYRSIRQKVKQKKETFAQLKAEAAKILDDCLY